MRKSPIRHHVRQHKRKGKPVHDYMRGKGERKPKLAKPRLKHQQSVKSNFHVKIVYSNLASESLSVTAANYPEAIETALTIRREITPPWQIDAKKLK